MHMRDMSLTFKVPLKFLEEGLVAAQKRGISFLSLSGVAVTIFFLSSLTGCTTGGGMALDGERLAPPGSIVWPAPPSDPRVGYVKTLRRPGDLGGRRGVIKSVVDLLVGPNKDRVIKPFGISVDSRGRVLIADSAFKSIHIFDVAAKKYKRINRAGGELFTTPMGVAVDLLDNIYISDSGAGKVFILNRKGRLIFTIDGIGRPTGIAIDNNEGFLYVVDTSAHDIKVFDLKGDYIKTLGLRGGEDGEFNYPVDIFVDSKGDLFVSDSMNFRVQVLSKEGRLLKTFGEHGDSTGKLGRPKGLAVDRDGNIYVVDAIFDTVQIFNRDGDFLLNFGSRGTGPGNFWLPSGIYIDNNSYIYVADSYNGRVQVFEYLGGN